MSCAVRCSAPSTLAPHSEEHYSGRRWGGGSVAMLRAARSRLLGRAAALSSLGGREATTVSKTAAGAQARAAARAEAGADASNDAKVWRPCMAVPPAPVLPAQDAGPCTYNLACPDPSAAALDAVHAQPHSPSKVCRWPVAVMLSLPPPCAAAHRAAVPPFCLPPQARALDSVLKEINSRFGKNSIMKLGSNSYGEV